jgi:2',3'-cyclic-nucleotide 2'-phosphodiesterase/3'-nucleotidase
VDTAAKRIKNARYNGERVTYDMNFAIATNNYRAAGGGDFPLSFNTAPIYEGAETCRDIVLGHISKTPEFTPETAPTWSFTTSANTSVTFDTGLGALKYINDGSHPQYTDTGVRENGFARLRFAL